MIKIKFITLILSYLLVSCSYYPSYQSNIGLKTEVPQNKNYDKKELSLHKYGFEGYQIRGAVDWSPSGKYLLIQATKYTNTGKNKYKTLIYDISEDYIFNVSEELLVGGFDWSSNDKKLTFANISEGLVLFDLDTKNKLKIDKYGSRPVFSPDGNKIAFNSEGICVYKIGSRHKEKVTSNGWDRMPNWFSDSENIIYIRDLRKYPKEIIAIGQRMSKVNINEPEKFIDIEPQPMHENYSSAMWVVPDKKFIMSASGIAGKYKDYFIDIEKKTIDEIGEWSIKSPKRELIVDSKLQRFLWANNNKIDVYDFEMNKKYTYKGDEQKGNKEQIQFYDFKVDSKGKIFFKKRIGEAQSSTIIMLNQDLTEVRAVADSAAYGEISISPDGRTLAIVLDSTKIKLMLLNH